MSKTSQRKVSKFSQGRKDAMDGLPRQKVLRRKGQRHPFSGAYNAGYCTGRMLVSKGITKNRGGIFSRAYKALMQMKGGQNA